MSRNYAKENKWQNTPEQVNRRVARNRARRHAIADGRVSKGDGQEVHHMGSHRKGSLDKVRTTVISKKANREMQPKRIEEEQIDEVDQDTLKTQYRNWGYWDGKADREQGTMTTRWAKAYVYRAMKPFQKEYWDGYYAGYYNKLYTNIMENELLAEHYHDENGKRVPVLKNPTPQKAYDYAKQHGGSSGSGRYFAHGDGHIHMWGMNHSFTHTDFMEQHGVEMTSNNYSGAGVYHSPYHAHEIAKRHMEARRENKKVNEDAPINNVGAGHIAGVGVANPSKPTMWGEPGVDMKKRRKHMLMQMLGRWKNGTVS